jgi:peptidoglycan/xylan/chitin deacetylase (PgdA/CDA1 family)
VTHPILTNVSDAQLETEIARTKSLLEQHLRRPAIAFAYPNGDRASFNRTTQEAIMRHGFRYAVSYGVPYGDESVRDKARYRYALPRIAVERGQSFELFRANLMFPRLMSR